MDNKLFYRLKDKKFEFNSQQIKKGSYFIALKGKRDGHLFINDALKRGAKGLIINKKKFHYIQKRKKDIDLIYTKDTFRFFKNFALFKRKLYKNIKIALTGSVGKTTTKDFLFYLLSKFDLSYKNIESYNNILGLIYTLSNLDLKSKFYIQELGTNNFGEIKELTNFLKPNIRIITKIGEAHLETFKNKEGVIKAKLEILEGNSFDFAILPEDLKEYIKNFYPSKLPKIYFFNEDKAILEDFLDKNFNRITKIKIFDKTITVKSKILGKGFLTTLVIGAYLLYLLNLDLNILEDITTFSPPPHRLNLKNYFIFGKKILIIDDTYNANPTSFENLAGLLKDLKEKYNAYIITVFGKMEELGENSKKEHIKVNNLLKTFSKVFHYNIPYFNSYIDKTKLFNDLLKEIKNSTKEFIILGIKGSRSNQLEELINLFKEFEKKQNF